MWQWASGVVEQDTMEGYWNDFALKKNEAVRMGVGFTECKALH